MGTENMNHYVNKMILAPMVRVGTLPARLLAIRYGADLVYSEEIVDYKLARCTRVVNPVLDTVDFVTPEGLVVFRTCAEEKQHVVLQIGTAHPDRAVEVLKLVEKDIFGLDVNMGCPKKFSIKGGMGAALLSELDLARDIMKALVDATSIPITMKMRMLSTKEKTIEFMRAMESTGIVAIGLHGRQRHHRPSVACDMEMMGEVAKSVKIPVIANGGGSVDISSYEDAQRWKEKSGCSSIMLARSAQFNLSVFRKEGPLPRREVALEYLKLAFRYNNVHSNSKFCLLKLLANKDPVVMDVATANESIEFARAFEIEDYFLKEVSRQHELAIKYDFKVSSSDDQIDEAKGTPLEQLLLADEAEADLEINNKEDNPSKKAKVLENLFVLDIDYKASFFRKKTALPRWYLKRFAALNRKKFPTFETHQQLPSRKFFSVCLYDGYKFSHAEPIANKKQSLQAAALVALIHYKLVRYETSKTGTSLTVLDERIAQ